MNVSDGSTVNGKQKVAEEMNQYFARIGEATVNSNLNDCLDAVVTFYHIPSILAYFSLP